MSSETPRTDEVMESGQLQRPTLSELAGHARTLERELAAAKAIQHAEKAILIQEIEAHTKTKAEVVGWENKWKCAVEMAARAEVERDELLNKAKELLRERDDLRASLESMKRSVEYILKQRDEARDWAERLASVAKCYDPNCAELSDYNDWRNTAGEGAK